MCRNVPYSIDFECKTNGQKVHFLVWLHTDTDYKKAHKCSNCFYVESIYMVLADVCQRQHNSELNKSTLKMFGLFRSCFGLLWFSTFRILFRADRNNLL